MKREPPRIDTRRTEDFRGELLARARAWIRDWSLGEAPGDFGAALLDAASRLSSQVAERLDRAGEKLSLGLLDWLAVRGKAARPARMPVAFKLADTAREPVLALRGTRQQADVDGASVVFETETDVQLVPGTLAHLVAVDTGLDAYYLPPPGLSSLEPLDPLPNRWTLKNFADQGATKLQLDPALGLAEGTLIEIAGHQYRITKVDGDLIDIDPGVQNAGGLSLPTEATRVQRFDPFGGTAHNQQEHIVYLGDKDLFNIEAAATLEILGTNNKLTDANWEYFGKSANGEEAAWRKLAISEEPAQTPGALRLEKPAGAVEPTDVGNVKGARWIRAWQTSVADENGILETDALGVVLNPGAGSMPCSSTGTAPAGAEGTALGFANTLPLSFNSPFYPLGREPKQFDSFYLGSTDAFSKYGANVRICFELADASADSFGVLGSGTHAQQFVASVGQDSALHIYQLDAITGTLRKHRNLDPLQPPKPRANGVAPEGAPVALVQKPKWRPAIWEDPNDTDIIYFATAAGSTVWVWKEDLGDANQCGWMPFGPIVASSAANAQVAGLVYLRQPQPMLLASFDGKLYAHSALEGSLAQGWAPVPLKDFAGANDLPGALTRIGPVTQPIAAGSEEWQVSGIVGVIEDGGRSVAHAIGLGGNCLPLDPLAAADVMADAIPCGFDDAGAIYYFWKAAAPAGSIRAVRAVTNLNPLLAPALTPIGSTPLAGGPDNIVGSTLDVFDDNGDVTVVAVGSKAGTTWLLTWAPFSAAAPASFAQNELPAGSGPLGGAPTLAGTYIVAPGTQGDAWVSAWDPDASIADSVTPRIGLITDNPSLLIINDIVIRDMGAGNTPESASVNSYIGSSNGKYLYSLSTESGDPAYASVPNPNLFFFRHGTPGTELTGVRNKDDEMDITGDSETATGTWLALLTSAGIKFAQATRSLGDPDVVTLDPDPTLTEAATKYWRALPLNVRVAPWFTLGPAAVSAIHLSHLVGTPLVFNAPLAPRAQFAESFQDNGLGHPLLLALKQNWTTAPNNNNARNFTFDASTTSWRRQFERRPMDPELIWEYWNGTSWTKLELDADETQDLTGTGLVKFRVPATLAPTDVSGKDNHWIRARLIGGDYGREIVTVETRPNPNVKDGTIQEVVRDTSNFHPPLVVNMRIRYSVTSGAVPTYLLTQDSGSLRDQSDANRTPEAKVEAFVPLSVLMKRLAPVSAAESSPVSPAQAGGETAPCACGPGAQAKPAVPSGAPATQAKTASSANDARAILLGFDGMLLGEPVNVLLLNEERPHDEFAPLTVEALNRDRFEVLTVKDTTRALGESGLLSMSLPVQPSAHDLFGSTCAWLRLHPSRLSANGQWRPAVRGAYLNTAWARATETLTREPLGSSDGRPALTLNLARPPLLENSLELRVREPLDEEERKALLDADEATDPDAGIVKFDLPDLPGDWVLWRQVPDPADYGPRDRVYALDESSGEILFGDGIHGMIPPIGRDSIVAFRYQRTEPAADGGDTVPANAVTARTALNLVTPVEGVEAAFAAEHAAGGSPPESTARVLRFGSARLRHRGRAVVPRDFEDLARASSSNVAQAHAFRRSGGLRLVVVMAGAEPRPTAVERRAFQRLLLEAAAPSFGEKAGLTVDGPRLRRLRVHLALRVNSLDDAGETTLDVKDALRRFFDAATGGVDGEGWPLGTAPADDDIAFALAQARGLESIANISFAEVGEDGAEIAWRPAARSDELVMLDADPVRIAFEALEAEA